MSPVTQGEGDGNGVLTELRGLEPIFHRSASGSGRATFEAMTTPDFWEVGASGTRHDRETVLDELERRHADPAYDPLDGLEVSESSGCGTPVAGFGSRCIGCARANG